MAPSKMPLDRRLWVMVDRTAGAVGCWPWKGRVDPAGYGRIKTSAGVQIGAHKAAWLVTNGAVAGDLFVCHRCDNRRCCNPAHLFLGSAADNNSDMRSKGRGGFGFRAQLGEKNGAAKLTSVDVECIRVLGAKGVLQKTIAARFGVSRSRISEILSGKSWPHPQPADSPGGVAAGLSRRGGR